MNWYLAVFLIPQAITTAAVWITSGRGTTPAERAAIAIRARTEHRERR